MSEQLKPKMWSDFDGTAVEIVPKTNPRNWSKYPLRMVDGYTDFLRGVQKGGVDLSGIVSRRPDILPRRVATARSIAKLGLDSYFSAEGIILAGSEGEKAGVVARQSINGVVGMIDDKPHKLGIALLHYMREETAYRPAGQPKREVVVGAVNHQRTEYYLGALVDWATVSDYDLHTGPDGIYIGDPRERFAVHVVQLDPYSEDSGQAFAEQLARF